MNLTLSLIGLHDVLNKQQAYTKINFNRHLSSKDDTSLTGPEENTKDCKTSEQAISLFSLITKNNLNKIFVMSRKIRDDEPNIAKDCSSSKT